MSDQQPYPHEHPQPGPPGGYGAPPPTGYGAPTQNPYGGYTTAPPPGVRSMAPGTIGYVETHFGPVAGFGDRVLALLVDTLVSLVALLPMLVAIPFIVAGVPDQSGYDTAGYPEYGPADTSMLTTGFVLLGLGVLLSIGINLWNRVFRMGRTGQSIGKSVLNLRLVHASTGQPIGAGMCFVREVLSSLINQAFYLSYLWMLWDGNRQTLADMVVSSTVVKVPKA